MLTGDGDMMGDSDGLVFDVVSRPLLKGRNGVMNVNKHKSRQVKRGSTVVLVKGDLEAPMDLGI